MSSSIADCNVRRLHALLTIVACCVVVSYYSAARTKSAAQRGGRRARRWVTMALANQYLSCLRPPRYLTIALIINTCSGNMAMSRYREVPCVLLGTANTHRSKARYRASNFPTLPLVPLVPCKRNCVPKQWPQTMQSNNKCDIGYALAI